MRRTLVLGAAVAALFAPAGVIAIPISGRGALGSFVGTFDYDGDSVEVTLTNTSPAANGGFITGFVFNLPAGVGVSSLSSSDTDFGLLGSLGFANNVNGAPFGRFDTGAATGGSFEGGGQPSLGIGVGASASWSFALTGSGLGGLTGSDFLSLLSVPPGAGEGPQSFVVRFRGFDSGGSDKVALEGDTPIPEPATALLFGLGMGALAARRLRRRRG